MGHDVPMSFPLLSATAVAVRAGRSRSSLHRDIEAGLLTPAAQLPGATGAYVFTEDEAVRYVAAIKADS